MNKGLFVAWCIAAVIFCPASAYADDVTGSTNNNTDVSIPDASAIGVPTSASTITITQNEIIEQATFTIEGLAHTFVGDLVAVVRHVESGKSVTLFSRIGREGNSPAPGNGDSSNFDGDYEFFDANFDFDNPNFGDATNNGLWEEAARGETGYTLRDKNDLTQNNPGIYRAAAGNTGAPISINDVFAGESTQGTWQLELSDRNASQIGSFREFKVSFATVTAIPEPSTLGFLAAASLGGLLLRRKRMS